MKRLEKGIIIYAPTPSNQHRFNKQNKNLISKAVTAFALIAFLAFSVNIALSRGITEEVSAPGQMRLLADSNRTGASVEEETRQEGIIFESMPDDIKLEILGFVNDRPKAYHIDLRGPQVLIYHTHTLEAYRQIEGQEYVEAGSWRTKDFDCSVVAVGEVLEAELESYGFMVLHDTTNYEPPSLKTAYSRSLETMEKYAKKYPTLRVFIDLHRDAYNDMEAGKKDFVTVDGNECARMMFVVDNGLGYDIKPDYESNFKLAQSITNELEKIHKGFTRPIYIKSHSHNQNVSDMCLLIEVGHNANSLEQAKNAAKYAALAISRVVAID